MKGGLSLSRASSTIHAIARSSRYSPRRRNATLAPDHAFGSTSVVATSQLTGDATHYNDLKQSLSRSDGPSTIWGHYTHLLSLLGYDKLPLELHQEVLRRCTSSPSSVRASAGRRMIKMKSSTIASPHVHEGRFQSIIRNIRASGHKPALEDYHFIMRHFAAVGHHTGTLQVYNEIVQLGLSPESKTFGLCLQAIAHRLTLPVLPEEVEEHTRETRSMVSGLLAEMQKRRIPLTSISLDFLIRILKETSDRASFEALLRWGYGIDLSNPDLPPLEYSTEGSPGRWRPQPFSTSALNTTIECLGRFGDVSKMIQAFEVLTTPLPKAAQYMFSSFDDEEDFGVDVETSSQPFVPPSARPNTTTYNILLRHLGKARHSVLLRHYLLEVISTERHLINHIKAMLVLKTPPGELEAPSISVSRGTLLPVLGSSNRDRDVGLMRWLSVKMPLILRRKHHDLEYFKRQRDRMAALAPSIAELPIDPPPTSDSTSSLPPEPEASTSTSAPVEAGSLGFFSSASSFASHLPSFAHRFRWDTSKSSPKSPLDLNIDFDTEIPLPPPPKRFNIDLHISILQRDIIDIEDFAEQLETTLARSTQRLKEKLGRRVWNGKDIYIRTSDQEEERVRISRRHWQDIVGYRPRPEVELTSKEQFVAVQEKSVGSAEEISSDALRIRAVS
ncbi:hypothetical protein BDN72DRAFT_810122 [Pluteus cervinus]|uniref:Uncharacterized protein n=1 Tax=Pluteus cervinus TaxID=181527 RepID=A0ACD3BDL7_9AGAR|nr:hypothetical protein BDN72DRAFT_810122 [Pluteus cervinus]